MGFSAAAASNLGASIKKHSCVPGPRADLVRCNFVGADLAGADLAGARLNRAKLRDANLTGANLTDTKLDHAVLIRADLSAVTSGGITGTPASLPTNWILVDGYLIGPGADLAGANLSHANLLGATGSRIERKPLRRGPVRQSTQQSISAAISRRDTQSELCGHGADEPGHRRGRVRGCDCRDGRSRRRWRRGASNPGALALVHPASLS